MCHREYPHCGKLGYARESSVCCLLLWWHVLKPCRWLIDTDQDAAGLRVIVDLHGGDPNNVLAQAEYQEIKDKVLEEVR